MACKQDEPTALCILRPNECFISRWHAVLEAMRKSEELCDVKIITQNGSIFSHRVILCAAIPLFRSMFRSSMEESQRKEISMDGVDPSALELLVNFVYGYPMEITTENAQSLLMASDFLQMDDIKEECCIFMSYNLNSENVFEVKSFALTMNCCSLIEECHNYIKKNVDVFCHCKSFQSLSLSKVQDVVTIIGNAEKALEAIISWVKAPNVELDYRKDTLDTLLSNVRFDEMSLDFLCETVSPEGLIQNSAPFKEFVEKAKASRSSKLPPFLPSQVLNKGSSNLNLHKLRQMPYIRIDAIFSPLASYTPPRRQSRKSHSFEEYDESKSQGLYAVCHSFSFGLYVRHYDAIKEKWVTLGDGFPFNACSISALASGDRIFAFGDSSFRIFYLQTRLWQEFSKDESPFDYIFLLHRNKVYVFEKYLHAMIRNYLLDDTRNIIKSFTLPKGNCIPAGEMTRCSDGFSVVSLDDYIYVTGGATDSTCVDIAERYQPESKLWTTIEPMPTAKKNHSSAALNGKIYVCGGFTDAKEFLDSVECYSNDSSQWTCVAPMKMRRSSFSLTSGMGKLFLIDCAESCRNKYCFEIYEPDTDEWKNGPPLFVVDDVKETQIVLTLNPAIDTEVVSGTEIITLEGTGIRLIGKRFPEFRSNCMSLPDFRKYLGK